VTVIISSGSQLTSMYFFDARHPYAYFKLLSFFLNQSPATKVYKLYRKMSLN